MTRKTSRLLIDQPPLQVQPRLAVQVGLNEALVLQQVHYWLGKTKADDKHTHPDEWGTVRLWVYNTVKEWQEQFPFWSKRTIERIVAGLETEGYLLSGNFNETKFDRTKWYTIDYDLLEGALEPDNMTETNPPDCRPPFRQLGGMESATMAEPIPETTRRIPTETTAESSALHAGTATPPPSNPSYAIFSAYLSTTGKEDQHLDPDWKKQQLGIARELHRRGYAPDHITRMCRYLQSQAWRTAPFDLRAVSDTIGTWQIAGEPSVERPPAKGADTFQQNLANLRLVGDAARARGL